MIKKSLLFLLLMTLFAPWAAKAQTELTVNDGTTTNTYIPVYGSYVDTEGAKSEFIIPAETTGMSALVGGSISKLTFYISGTPNTWGSPTIQVYMGEVTETTISAIHSPSDFTIVSTSVWSNQSSTIEVNLDTPFIYEGGNLLIGTYVQSESSTYKSTSFYGVSATSGSSRYYTSYGTGTPQSFLPKTTLTYTAGSGTLCKKPSGLEATLTPGNGTVATLNWTENGTATDWVLEYGTAPDFTGATSMTTGFTVSGTTVTANLTGLTAESKYYARVKADCGGGSESAWSATCEFTPTNNLTLTLNDGTNTNSYIPIYGYYADATQRAEFIIPATNLASIDGATLNSMKFYANYNFTSTGTFQVYLKEVKDETFSGTTFYTADEATTVYTGTVTVSSTDGMTITFNSGFDYEGGNLLVGFYQATGGNCSSSGANFYGVTSSGSSISMYSSQSASQRNFLPKVTFAYSINPFKAPKNLAVSNVTNNSATVSWEAPASGTPTGYKYQYMPEGGSWTTLTSTTALSAPLTGLTANTNYTFQVQAIYSGGESGFVTTTFTTDCDSYPIPYPYGFEDVTDMNCWTVIDDPGRTGIDDGTSLGATAHEGANYFVFTYYDYPDTDPQYMTLISPELSGIVGGLHVEFYYLTDGNSSYPETFSVGYSTTNTNLSSFTWSNTVTDVVATNYELFKANFPAGTKYIAVQHRSDDMDYLILDDFSFTEAPSCVEPSNLQVSNITTSGANLSWTIGGTATTWDIYVTEDVTDVPDDATTPTYAGVTTNTNYPISGLKPATTYYLYVRSACDATTHSDWTMPTSFNTECETMPLPFQYDFEDDALSVCWNTIGLNTGWITSGISSTAPQHGSKHYVITTSNYATGTQYIVLPEVDASYPLNEYEITFYSELAGNSTTGRSLAVGVMTDPNDASTFVQIGDAFTPATSYQQYKVRLNTYTGSGQYIAIKQSITSASYYADYTYIDNLEVSHLPSCIEPSDPTISEITAHTAKLTWTGTSASYNIDYRTAAYTDGLSEEFSTTSAPSGWTRYSGALSTDGTGPTSTYSGGWSFGTNQFSSIHAYMNVYSTNKYWLVTPSVTIGNGYNMSFDVAYTAYNSTSAAGTTGTDDRFCVLISTDEKAHWTILREWNNAGTGDAVLNDIPVTFQTINDIDISSYKGQTVYFAFYGESTTSNADNTLRIDNVTIGTPVAEGTWQHTTSATTTKTLEGLLAQRKYEVKVQGDCGTEGTSEWSGIVNFTTDIACPAPSGLAYANLKSDHVDLSWTNGGAEDWVVAYKLSTDTDFTEVGVATADVTISGTTVTYTLTGLTPEKEYTVKVKDNCEASYPGDGTSEYTSTVTFTTLKACDTPTGVTISNIGHYSADLTWTGDSPEFIVKYRTAASINAVFSEEFSTSSLPTGWARYNTELTDDVLNGTTALTSASSGWGNTSYGLGQYNWKVNIWNTSCKYWMVTPSIDVTDNNSLSFDMALTAYNSNNAPTTANMPDANSRFVVLITDDDMATWTILREWNNSGSTYVLNDVSNTGTSALIDLSTYANSSVKIAFYCQQLVSGPDCDFHIDNVKVGTSVAAGTWQTLSPNPTTTSASLTGLTAGTNYEVTVTPSCDATLVSDPTTFTTVSENIKYFITEGNWNVDANWEPTGAPTIKQDVTLYANVTIPSGCVAEANSITGTGTGTGAYTLTINDGGQLKHNNTNVRATVKKTLSGYGAGNEADKANYHLISNPMYTNISTTSTPNYESTGLLTGTFDFYSWDNSQAGAEWRNYEKSTFSMSYGMYGYLYANESPVDLTFTGTIQKSDTYSSRYLYDYSSSYPFGGWSLLGNPYVCNTYLVNASTSGTGLPFYKMNSDGNGFEAVAAGTAIAPMEGFFYEATANGSVYLVRTQPAKDGSKGNLNINVAQVVTTRGAKGSRDNAIVQFGEGNTLGKFSFREDAAKIYIPQDGKNYAVVNADAQGELPVYFKAYSNGNYTLSFTAQDVDFSYLHLIDNLTGNDVDLLATPSYNFDARYTDYASRFKLVFATTNTSDDQFAFINDGQLILTGLTGGETLQVIDALGRVITSTNAFNHISTENMAPGVYVLRLINGNDVKTQKIVVR